MHTHPKRLRVSIGGYMGPSYRVELSGDGVRCEATDPRFANPRTRIVTPTDQ